MLDVSRINAQLWTGGAIVTDGDVRALRHKGITADVDCRMTPDTSVTKQLAELPPTPDSLVLHPRIAYLHAGVHDDGKPKPVGWFKTVWAFAQPVLKDGGVVLCHCAAGHNRGPSMAYFLLRAYWGMSPEAALALIRKRRPVAAVRYRGDADRAIVALGLTQVKEAVRMVQMVKSAGVVL